MTSIFIRCEKCGKVLKGRTQKLNIVGKCPRCKDKFVVPDPIKRDSRKKKRTIVHESKYVSTLPDILTKRNKPPHYRLIYTEVSPVEYALKRSDHVPLLDMSEDGLGFIIKTNDKSHKILPGDILYVALDFPVLVQPIYSEVEICWIKPIKEEKLMHVGARFHRPGEALKEVLKSLVKYIASKSQSLDFETWGSI